jgi:hypothetical protein
MRYEFWEGSEQGSGVWESTFVEEGDEKGHQLLLLSPYLKATWTFEAETLEEARRLVHQHTGRPPPISFDELPGPLVDIVGTSRAASRDD